MKQSLEHTLATALVHREEGFLLRSLRVVKDSKKYIDLAGNDYLGLSNHPEVMKRASEYSLKYGAGSQASRLVTGTLPIHIELEKKLAALKGTESALIFTSGWQANASIPHALNKLSLEVCKKQALFVLDKLAHASINFGSMGIGADFKRFRHNDLDHLESILEAHKDYKGLIFIITESVFSMDGDLAPIKEISALAKKYAASLYIDEAHSTGILGAGGRGISSSYADIIVGTGGKALGSQGAFVCGSERLIQWLANTASGFIYSTSPMPGNIGALEAAIDLLPSLEKERMHVADLANYLREKLNTLAYPTLDSSTQIIPVIIGDEESTLRLADYMKEHGFLVGAIRPPTVPKNTARLRISLHAGVTKKDLDRFCRLLGDFNVKLHKDLA